MFLTPTFHYKCQNIDIFIKIISLRDRETSTTSCSEPCVVCPCTEQCLRDEMKPLFGSLPSRQADCLSSLVKFAAVCSQVIQPDVVKKHCITLLSGQ